jgi:hypothetical protein
MEVTMKKYLKYFIFWFFILGILYCILGKFGILTYISDYLFLPMNLNVMLNRLMGRGYLDLVEKIPFIWDILTILTFLIYGLILDFVKFLILKLKNSYKRNK